MEFNERENVIPVEFGDNSKNEGDVKIEDRTEEPRVNELRDLLLKKSAEFGPVELHYKIINFLKENVDKRKDAKEAMKSKLFNLVSGSTVHYDEKTEFDVYDEKGEGIIEKFLKGL